MTFKIEITDTYVHVIEQRTRRLVDQDTGEVVEVPAGDHASAIGLGDFNGDAEAFKAAISAKVEAVAGKDLANVIAAKAADTEIAKADAAVDVQADPTP